MCDYQIHRHTSIDDRKPSRPRTSRGSQYPSKRIVQVSQLHRAQSGHAGVVICTLHDSVFGRTACVVMIAVIVVDASSAAAPENTASTSAAPTERVEVRDLGSGHGEERRKLCIHNNTNNEGRSSSVLDVKTANGALVGWNDALSAPQSSRCNNALRGAPLIRSAPIIISTDRSRPGTLTGFSRLSILVVIFLRLIIY